VGIGPSGEPKTPRLLSKELITPERIEAIPF